MIFRPYNSDSDHEAVCRIIRECGWPNPQRSKEFEEAYKNFLKSGSADVVEWNGQAETLVTTHKGSISMPGGELPLCAVTSVCVSQILRRSGAATRLTARVLADMAQECTVAALGIFDQGFYNKLGFGAFPYSYSVAVDPITLMVPGLKRRPVRLGFADAGRMLRNFLGRMPHHGQVQIPSEEFLAMGMHETENGLGIGFENGRGELSHHLWMAPEKDEDIYTVYWMVFNDLAGLIELLSFVKSLADQVKCIHFTEPSGIQIQDLLSRPFRMRESTEGGKYRNELTAESWHQARILNMEKTFSALKIPHGELSFELELFDPIDSYLADDGPWRGVGGLWSIHVGENGSEARKVSKTSTVPVRASVNALTRLVFGVQKASNLQFMDDFSAPDNLIRELDKKLCLPLPFMDWDF